MKDNAREFIIKNLRQALVTSNKEVVPPPPMTAHTPHFRLKHDDDIVFNFVKQYMLCGGTLDYGTNNAEVAEILNKWIIANKIDTVECGTSSLVQYIRNLGLQAKNITTFKGNSRYGIVLCETLVAWDGSIVITSDCFEGNEKILMPENIVLVAFSSQVVRDFKTYTSQKGKESPLPKQMQILYPENLDHKKTQMLLIEDQN